MGYTLLYLPSTQESSIHLKRLKNAIQQLYENIISDLVPIVCYIYNHFLVITGVVRDDTSYHVCVQTRKRKKKGGYLFLLCLNVLLEGASVDDVVVEKRVSRYSFPIPLYFRMILNNLTGDVGV